MPSDSLSIQQLLEAFQSQAVAAPAPPGAKNTVGFLLTLARRWPDPPDENDRQVLDTLCRKVDVVGQVWAQYDADWKKPLKREPLSDANLVNLAAVLLAAASVQPQEDIDARGVALKLVNSTFKAIDLVENPDAVVGCGEVAALAERLLDERVNIKSAHPDSRGSIGDET